MSCAKSMEMCLEMRASQFGRSLETYGARSSAEDDQFDSWSVVVGLVLNYASEQLDHLLNDSLSVELPFH